MTNANRTAQRHGSSSTLTRARAAACVRARARTPRRAQFHIDFGIVHSEITEIPQPMSPGYIINMCVCVCGRMQYIHEEPHDEGCGQESRLLCGLERVRRPAEADLEKLVYCCRIIAAHQCADFF